MRLLFLSLVLPCLLPAQILRIDDSYDVERLVNDVFLSGQCETITNVQTIGNNPFALGYFEGGQSSVGFERGIIMSTGRADLAVGPNQNTDTGFAHSRNSTEDLDLNAISTGTIYDRAGIEFDFVPLTSTITFRYVFASEEYCDYVGQEFNDVFGFFISGPGIQGPYNRGAENLARLPGSGEAVSINTANYSQNSEFYLDNEFPVVRRISGCGGRNRPGPRFELIEYDGQTTILTATIDVRPCRRYHLRMVLGDVRDRQLDSAVFLDAGSFNLGGSVTLDNAAADDAPVVVNEGCNADSLYIRRGPDSDPATPQTVNYRIAGPGTATEGVDLDIGSGTVTLLPGQDSVAIPVTAFADDRTEGDETAWVYLDIPCACYNDSIQVIVAEPAPLEIEIEEAFYCPNVLAQVRPRVSGGVPPYVYTWSFNSTEAQPTLPAPLPDTIGLTVTDACGATAEKTIFSSTSPPPTFASRPQRLSGCRGDTVPLNVRLTGQPPFTLTYQIDGRVEEETFTASGEQIWELVEGGMYRLLELRDEACSISLDTTFGVDFVAPDISARITEPTCAGEDDGRIEIDHLRTLGPYTYQFTGRDTTELFYENLEAGEYSVRITDADGCTDFRELVLREPVPILPPRIDCENLRRPPLTAAAEGGQPPYQYSIDGREYFGQEGLNALPTGEFYDLRIRDDRGCEIVADDFFWPVANRRMARLPGLVTQEVAGQARVEADYLVPTPQLANFRWYPEALFNCANCPRPLVSAPETQSISLVVQDIYGCTDSLITQVTIDDRIPVYVPNIFSPNGDGVNDLVSLYANPAQVTRVATFRIHSRWGALVYQDGGFGPADYERGWDGRVGGRPAAADAFVWVAQVILVNGRMQEFSGSVVLSR